MTESSLVNGAIVVADCPAESLMLYSPYGTYRCRPTHCDLFWAVGVEWRHREVFFLLE
ncbi:hypothetical protein BaRGS_00033870, partial [Batillaria attramentaria]